MKKSTCHMLKEFLAIALFSYFVCVALQIAPVPFAHGIAAWLITID